MCKVPFRLSIRCDWGEAVQIINLLDMRDTWTGRPLCRSVCVQCYRALIPFPAPFLLLSLRRTITRITLTSLGECEPSEKVGYCCTTPNLRSWSAATFHRQRRYARGLLHCECSPAIHSMVQRQGGKWLAAVLEREDSLLSLLLHSLAYHHRWNVRDKNFPMQHSKSSSSRHHLRRRKAGRQCIKWRDSIAGSRECVHCMFRTWTLSHSCHVAFWLTSFEIVPPEATRHPRSAVWLKQCTQSSPLHRLKQCRPRWIIQYMGAVRIVSSVAATILAAMWCLWNQFMVHRTAIECTATWDTCSAKWDN